MIPAGAVILSAQLLVACSAKITSEAQQFDAAALGVAGSAAQPHPVHLVGARYMMNGRWYHPKHQPDYLAVGAATWYDGKSTGRLTANGERADAQNLFAAHPTLPLPSYVEVTNLANNRVLTVRVNDRGPYDGRSILSVSERAAAILGLQQRGRDMIRVRYLAPAPIRHIGRHHS